MKFAILTFFFFLLHWAALGILHPQYESPDHKGIPTILIIFSTQFSGVKYTHIAVQSSPLSISRACSPSHTETPSSLSTDMPFPTPSPGTHRSAFFL